MQDKKKEKIDVMRNGKIKTHFIINHESFESFTNFLNLLYVKIRINIWVIVMFKYYNFIGFDDNVFCLQLNVYF